ncbi:MAG: glycosyltransferase family 2 protein [Patescibacteria group bacterium]
MKYSVILPIFNEQENLDFLYNRVVKVLVSLKEDYEIIFINDGSQDRTKDILIDLHKKNNKIKIINFSRNFGHQIAVTAGLNFATGDRIAILDADLQDPPEILPNFFAKLNEGYDVVYAVRKKRKENIFKRIAYSLFYKILHLMASVDIPLDSGDFCVLSQRMVKTINSFPERNRFVRGLRSWAGFKQIGLEYEREKRLAGKSKYGLGKLLKLAFDGIFSFSFIPLQIMFLLGSASLFLSIMGIFWATYMKFFTTAYNRVPGFATTTILIMFVGGLQLFSIGIMGEYLRRVYDEVKQRPQYIIESKIGF